MIIIRLLCCCNNILFYFFLIFYLFLLLPDGNARVEINIISSQRFSTYNVVIKSNQSTDNSWNFRAPLDEGKYRQFIKQFSPVPIVIYFPIGTRRAHWLDFHILCMVDGRQVEIGKWDTISSNVCIKRFNLYSITNNNLTTLYYISYYISHHICWLAHKFYSKQIRFKAPSLLLQFLMLSFSPFIVFCFGETFPSFYFP